MPHSAIERRLVLAAAPALMLGVVAHAAAAPVRDADLSSLLQAQTQAFSDAGQKGDAATMARLLDAAVVFTNEAGDIATKQDLVEGASPPPASAPKRVIQVTNWAMHRQGEDMATATFIDQVSATLAGQALVLKFQSTETWVRRADGWKMIVSQTMNVPQTPAAIALPPAMLDDYVGTYRLGTIYAVRIRRDGDGLTASVNGGAPVQLKAEARDVLFTATALNVRRIFQRDEKGRVVGYINRRDGADLLFAKAV